MPFGALERRALGLSLLKARLAAARHRMRHPLSRRSVRRLDRPGRLPVDRTELPYTAFAGDWCFTEALYGRAGRDARLRTARSCATLAAWTTQRIRRVLVRAAT